MNKTDLKLNGINGVVNNNRLNHVSQWTDLTYGMFVHLGVYSELGGKWKGESIDKGYSEQIQMWAGISHKEYRKVAESFDLSNFDSAEIVSLAKEAGMTYLVITSKHHDGFCLFHTETTDFNIVSATPFKKDVVKLLADECRKQGIQLGIYYSLIDWHMGHDFDYDNGNCIPLNMETVIEKQLTELMTNYGDIVEVWFDMGSPTPEQSEKFSQIVRQYQPNAAINGRIWNNKGDFRTLDDNQIPENKLEGAWQTPASIYNETWGYRKWQQRNDSAGKAKECLENLISVRARGGNYLLNIGPKGDGSLVSFESQVLKKIGEWLSLHSAAVMKTKPTLFTSPEWGEITTDETHLYLHVFKKPKDNRLTLNGLASVVKDVLFHGDNQPLNWIFLNNKLTITLPEAPEELVTTIFVRLESPLSILPHHMVAKNKGIWCLKEKNLDKGYNFTDKGSYHTLEESNVSVTGYIVNTHAQKVSVSIEGKADNQLVYEVSIGGKCEVVYGSKLTESEIGPFILSSANSIVPVTIRLANPTHHYQDLSLTINKILVQQIN